MPSSTPPFNGLRLTAQPSYDSRGQLFKLAILLEDFTKLATGARVTHTFQPVSNGADLKLQAMGDFTLSGTLSLRRSPNDSDSIVIMLNNGSFGLPRQEKQVLGGLLEIPLRGPANDSAGSSPTGSPPGEQPAPSGDSSTSGSSPGSPPSSDAFRVSPDPNQPGGFRFQGQPRITLPDGRTFETQLDLQLSPTDGMVPPAQPSPPAQADPTTPSSPPAQADPPAQPSPPAQPGPPTATPTPTPPSAPPTAPGTTTEGSA